MARCDVLQKNGGYATFNEFSDDFEEFDKDDRGYHDLRGWDDALGSAIGAYCEIPDSVREAISLGLTTAEEVERILQEYLDDFEDGE